MVVSKVVDVGDELEMVLVRAPTAVIGADGSNLPKMP